MFPSSLLPKGIGTCGSLLELGVLTFPKQVVGVAGGAVRGAAATRTMAGDAGDLGREIDVARRMAGTNTVAAFAVLLGVSRVVEAAFEHPSIRHHRPGHHGEAFAIGERTPLAVLNPPASGRMAKTRSLRPAL